MARDAPRHFPKGGFLPTAKGGLMGESEERGSFRLVLGEGIVSVLEPCSSVLINPTRTLECAFFVRANTADGKYGKHSDQTRRGGV